MDCPAAAIFDMDGTLLDSMGQWNRAPGSCLREIYGVEPRPGMTEQLKTLTLEEGCEWLRQEYGLPDSAEAIAAGINAVMERFYAERVRPKPGAQRWLERLRARNVPMVIATSTDRALVETALKRTGLQPYFSAVFTCTEVGAGKAKPAVYEEAARFLGTPRETTWVFEDALFALRTAKAAGFRTGAVYDENQAALQSEIRALCDLYIPAYDTLSCPF